MQLKLRIPGPASDKVQVPVASSTTVEVGDAISFESGAGVKLDAAAEDATFAGVSETKSIDGQTDPLTLALKGVYEAPTESADYTIGNALSYNASNDTLEASTANTIAWAAENKAAATTLKVFVDVIQLGKLFAVNA